MEREQILLKDVQAKWLRKEAFTSRKSKSQIIRELIDKERGRRICEQENGGNSSWR